MKLPEASWRLRSATIVLCAVYSFALIILESTAYEAAGGESCEICLEFSVSAGSYDRIGTPIFVDLPATMRPAAAFELHTLPSNTTLPVQRITGEDRVVFLLEAPLAAGHSRTYRLTMIEDAPGEAQPMMTCRAGEDALVFEASGRAILRYHTAELQPPPGADPIYARSGFIHPLLTPSGKAVTDDFPPDHWHQHGVFFAWVKTTFEGRPVDFWNEAKRQGQVRHVKTLHMASGPVFAESRVSLRHEAFGEDGAARPALAESWTVRVYHTQQGNLIDLVSVQQTATDEPLVIATYHYGGMALRGARAWFEQHESDFLTSEGLTREDGNHSRPRWVDMHGLSGGEPAGLTVLGHPRNFRFPQPVRLHPSKPYFCFSPQVLGEFTIRPGQTYTSRYRLFAHDGRLDTATAERLWNDYAEPLEINVEKE